MSIEAMYPSRCQSKSNNPLFAGARRRQRLGFMIALALLGLGLLLLQLLPMNAHAGGSIGLMASATIEPIKLATPSTASRSVRQIPIYELHGSENH